MIVKLMIWIVANKAAILAGLPLTYELFARLFPTRIDISLFNKIVALIDFLVPNRKKTQIAVPFETIKTTFKNKIN